MSEPLSYQEVPIGARQPEGRRSLPLRLAGPVVWGVAALVVVAVGTCTSPAILFVWIAMVFISALLWSRALRGMRRARGLLVLAWLEAAVRLNLPLTNFLQAAAAGERGKLRRRLNALAQALATGRPTGDAVAEAVPEIPPRVALQLTMAERMGRLAPALGRITERERFGQSQRGRGTVLLRGMYPAVMLLVGSGVVLFLMGYVLPKFNEIFKDFHAPMPPLTAWFFKAAEFFYRDAVLGPLLVVLPLLALLAVVGRAMREIAAPWWPRTTPRRLTDAVAWRVPVVRRLARDRALADVCESLGEAVRAGMPFPQALGEAAALDMNLSFRRKVVRWRDAALAGKEPAAAARSAGMPAVLAGFLDPGQRQADLPDTLEFLARYFRVRHARLMALIADASEPFITLLIGLLVGLVMLAVFQPIVSLIDAVEAPAWRGVL
ncbi:MAG TPA: type II secretion system F family protein [Phycisphaerae bacterium]|nr:type II secretion system F family protein [Phycisphaerae bacterium]